MRDIPQMPHVLPAQPRRTKTLGHIPQHSPMSPNQSRYLTTNQHKRIESWRSLTDTSAQNSSPPASPPSSSSAHVHSVSARGSYAQSGGKSSPGTCPLCASRSACSCTTCSPKPRQKGYYKKSKSSKTAGRTHASATRGPHPAAFHPSPAQHMPKKNGMPTTEQIQGYYAGAPPPAQFGPTPSVPLPEAAVATPPTQPHPLPRIAGVRDPVSQN